MQDKYPIIVYGEDGTHIRDLLLDFIEKFCPVVVKSVCVNLWMHIVFSNIIICRRALV